MKRTLLLSIAILSSFIMFAQPSVVVIDKGVDDSYELKTRLQRNNIVLYTEGQIPEINPNTVHLFSHSRPVELLLNGKWRDAKQIVAFLSSANGDWYLEVGRVNAPPAFYAINVLQVHLLPIPPNKNNNFPQWF